MNLDERKQKILGAVVRDYVETVKPVGSEDLAARHDWGVKSATIRNELADLAEQGYLRQPHTSAGRIPSDQGYRFYVDHLMVARAVTGDAAEDEQAVDLERLLRQTCALLTRMTSYTSVATPPRPADTAPEPRLRLARRRRAPAGRRPVQHRADREPPARPTPDDAGSDGVRNRRAGQRAGCRLRGPDAGRPRRRRCGPGPAGVRPGRSAPRFDGTGAGRPPDGAARGRRGPGLSGRDARDPAPAGVPGRQQDRERAGDVAAADAAVPDPVTCPVAVRM